MLCARVAGGSTVACAHARELGDQRFRTRSRSRACRGAVRGLLVLGGLVLHDLDETKILNAPVGAGGKEASDCTGIHR